MLRVAGCIKNEHDLGLVLVAALVCVLGSILTVRMVLRARKTTGLARRVQVVLAGIVAGGMIWATHFIAMLAYDPVVEHGYEPIATGVSLGVAIIGATLAMGFATSNVHHRAAELGGAGFGLSVVTMHYLGMSAFLIPGEIVWEADLLIASVILAVTFGALSFHRISYPVSRYCWLGGALAMVLAICMMHFTGMAAITIELDPTVAVPPNPLSETTLAIVVLAAIVLVLAMGLAAFMIEARLAQDARHRLHLVTLTDPLTGLPNRLGLQNELGKSSNDLRGAAATMAILTIDLDMFKQINDIHGHAAGDAALIAISDRLKGALRQDEFIARTGGDEFIAIKRHIRDTKDGLAFAKRLRDEILKPVLHNDLCLQLGVSIGVSTTDRDNTDLTLVQEHSDIAMYRAKQQGESAICLFEQQMYDDDRARVALKEDLRHALSNDQFALVYQLQNDINSRQPVGFEALLRWHHPEKGLIGPTEFIPIAEETGLIRQIGLWVLRTSCIEAASWEHPYRIAVNVAPQQLVQPNFTEQIADALMESGLPSNRLELEITEDSIIHDHAKTTAVMQQIKAMGVRIAMDDFGTGYSSLATLQNFPFDKIKIDRSFVTGVHENSKRAAIIRATIMMAEAMNIPVLAEGVEDKDELDFLLAEKCAEVQGYFFGKPLTHDEMRIIAAPLKTGMRKAS